MNYSQRKHLERLMAQEPSWNHDPLGIWPSRSPGMFAGLKVIESPDVPRYTLPEEVIPGVPWPPGFLDEFNQWSRSFLGTTNMVPSGMAYVLAGGYTVMRRQDVLRISNIC